MLSAAVATATLEEFGQRSDALALRLGAKVTASSLLLAGVIVILIGAQSLLGAMQSMEADLHEMNQQMDVANQGLGVLNTTMDAVEPTADSLESILGSIQATDKQVGVAAKNVGAMAGTTDKLNTRLGSIAGSTTTMRGSLEATGGDAAKLGSTIGVLTDRITPLVKTQHSMFLSTRQMRTGLDTMNANLAYVVRIMNWITRPPGGGGMTIRAELPKETLPPLPGLRAEVAPVQAFPRDIWKVYTGP